jgi:hypothetical protein
VRDGQQKGGQDGCCGEEDEGDAPLVRPGCSTGKRRCPFSGRQSKLDWHAKTSSTQILPNDSMQLWGRSALPVKVVGRSADDKADLNVTKSDRQFGPERKGRCSWPGASAGPGASPQGTRPVTSRAWVSRITTGAADALVESTPRSSGDVPVQRVRLFTVTIG